MPGAMIGGGGGVGLAAVIISSHLRMIKLTPIVLCTVNTVNLRNWAEPYVGRYGTVQALLQLLLPTTRAELQVGERLISNPLGSQSVDLQPESDPREE